MLQSQLEFRLIGDYEEKFGLRELRVKLNEKAGFIFNANGSQGIRLAICADDCYGINAVEITQKYLDSGPLEEELGTFMTGRCWTGEDAQNFLVLTASAMTLGCSLSETVMKELQMMLKPQYQVLTAERGVPAFRTTFARSQMKKAVRDYKNGTPYDFGNTTMLENMLGHAAKTTTQNVGKMKIVETTMPNGMVVG